MRVHRVDVSLPHINYMVRIRPLSDVKRPRPGADYQAWTVRDNRRCSTVYLPQSCAPSLLAHEIVHVLRYIVLDRHMTFEHEFEHMAYIMQYVMGQALGFVWAKD